MLMEACFKHPEAMLVAANYTKGWANELLIILKERFGRVDRQVTQSLVQEFQNMEILPTEDGAKFVDRVKSNVLKIGQQNLDEKPTDNSIIAVLKSAIKDREPALYHLADLHDMQLDKLYQQIAKNVVVKKKVENQSDRVAASFTYDDLIALDEDRNASIQWTAGTDFHGSRQPLKGRRLTDQSSDLR